MATRKVKRLAGGFDKGEFEGVDEAITANPDTGEWARGEDYGDGTTGDERVAMARKNLPEASAAEVMAANKFADKPRPVSPKPSINTAKKEVTKEIKAKTSELKSDEPAAKTTRDEVKPKKDDTIIAYGKKISASEAAANRAKAWESLKGAASSVGDYLSSFGKRPEKHGTYRTTDDRGKTKIVRYAKGGSASSRADGIAQRGKTRGTMVACGGGYMKGKK